ncbi:MAG: hypothetical protein IJL98_09490 [Lachnospiraceae bacterium]|nr:hypothetical protein [Lachnospiraceae bacterium]
MKRITMILASTLACMTILAGAKSLFPDHKAGFASMVPAFYQINEVELPPTRGTD